MSTQSPLTSQTPEATPSARTSTFSLPDYRGGGIVNLMSSIIAACGTAEPSYAPLAALPPSALGTRRNLVLLVIDGLGYNYLQRVGRESALRQHLAARMTSVFPTTTATAITSFMSGLAPQQHGLTGWHMYFSEIDAVAAVLPLLGRQDTLPFAAAELPQRLFSHGNVFEKLTRPSWIISPQRIIDSPFNTYHSGKAARIGYTNLEEMFGHITRALHKKGGQKFIYAYHDKLDSLAHKHGISGDKVATHFHQIDQAFHEFLTGLQGSDTTVLVTADHGFIDTPPERLIEINQHPRLAQMLARPLCGEPRVAYCYVRPEARMEFEAYVTNELNHCAQLYPSAELVEQGWFGLGAPHFRLLDRIGDYTLLMKDNYTIKDWLPDEKRHTLLGAHGGLSEDELYVPLIMANT